MNRAEQLAYNKMCLRMHDVIVDALMKHHGKQPADPAYWTSEAKAERQALRDIISTLARMGKPLKDVDE